MSCFWAEVESITIYYGMIGNLYHLLWIWHLLVPGSEVSTLQHSLLVLGLLKTELDFFFDFGHYELNSSTHLAEIS
jgi:hypothetical protein